MNIGRKTAQTETEKPVKAQKKKNKRKTKHTKKKMVKSVKENKIKVQKYKLTLPNLTFKIWDWSL